MSLETFITSLLSLGLASASGYLLVKTWPNGEIKGWKLFLGTLFSIILGAILGVYSIGLPEGLIAGIGAGNLGPFIYLKAKGHLSGKSSEKQ